jgi:hypothetical protein
VVTEHVHHGLIADDRAIRVLACALESQSYAVTVVVRCSGRSRVITRLGGARRGYP